MMAFNSVAPKTWVSWVGFKCGLCYSTRVLFGRRWPHLKALSKVPLTKCYMGMDVKQLASSTPTLPPPTTPRTFFWVWLTHVAMQAPGPGDAKSKSFRVYNKEGGQEHNGNDMSAVDRELALLEQSNAALFAALAQTRAMPVRPLPSRIDGEILTLVSK